MDLFTIRRSALAVAAAMLAFWASASVHAQGLPRPRATVGATKAEFQPPLGMWRADTHSVAILFPTTPLSAEDETEARRDEGWPVEGVGPVATVELTFAKGTFSAALTEVESCGIGLYGFRGTPIEITGSAAQCHLVSTGGRLQPGGMLIGLIEGKGPGYDLRLPFTVMFPAATTTDAAVAVTPPAAPAAPAIPPNTVAGTGTYAGQTLTLTHGLAWASGTRIEVALFDHVPPPGILADLKSGSWGEGGPVATLTFDLEAGKTGPAAVTYCYVGLSFPKGGSQSVNVNQAKGCGLTTLEGTPTPGGSVVARLAGNATVRDQRPMAWDLRFHLTVAK